MPTPPRVLQSNQTQSTRSSYDHFAKQHKANLITTINAPSIACKQPLTAACDYLQPMFPFHYAAAVIDPNTGETLNYRRLIQNPTTAVIWTKSMAKKLGCLSQGVASRHLNSGTNTIFWIRHTAVPKGRTVLSATSAPQKRKFNERK
jgi:hypothetical protein